MPPKKQLLGPGRRRPDRVGQDGRPLAGARGAVPAGKRRPRRGRRAALGVPAGARPAAPRRQGPGLAADLGRSVHPGQARSEGPGALAAGRPADPDPPRHVRPDRPAADARGGRRVRGRPVARRLRAAGRPPAGLAALRRALGPALARRRPLRRHQGLRLRRGRRLPLGLHLPRLRRSAPSTTTCPTTGSSSSSSPPTGCRLGDDRRPLAALGLPDARRPVHEQRPRRHRRPDRRRQPRPAGPDGRLRPLPRPQVRPDPDRRTTTRSTASSPAPSSRRSRPMFADPPRHRQSTRRSPRSWRRASRSWPTFVAAKHDELVDALADAGPASTCWPRSRRSTSRPPRTSC